MSAATDVLVEVIRLGLGPSRSCTHCGQTLGDRAYGSPHLTADGKIGWTCQMCGTVVTRSVATMRTRVAAAVAS